MNELLITVKVKLGNDTAQTPEDVKKDILEDLEGLFEDISFLGNTKCETSKNVMDLNGNTIGVITLEVK